MKFMQVIFIFHGKHLSNYTNKLQPLIILSHFLLE